MTDIDNGDGLSTQHPLQRVRQFVEDASKHVVGALNEGRRALERRGVDFGTIWGTPTTNLTEVTRVANTARR